MTEQARSERGNWQEMCREQFGLTPIQLATLSAIVAYAEHNDGAAMPLEELKRLARETDGIYTVNATAPSDLYRLGFIHRIGPPQQRAYAPTPRAYRKVRE